MNGRYINLARSMGRREAMDAQLRRLGLHGISRFDAIDSHTLPAPPNDGTTRDERACFMSHVAVIDAAPADDFLLVLEDDALLSDALPAVLQSSAMSQLAPYDIVFLECLPYVTTTNLMALWGSLQRRLPPVGEPRHEVNGIDILEAQHLYNWGAVAYLVTPRGLGTLPPLLHGALRAGASPFDMTLNRLVHAGHIRAAVLSPFLATPRLESHADTTITDRPQADANDVLGGALRRLFFAGPVDGLEAHAAAHRHAALTDDAQLRLLADLMAQLFVLTVRAT